MDRYETDERDFAAARLEILDAATYAEHRDAINRHIDKLPGKEMLRLTEVWKRENKGWMPDD